MTILLLKILLPVIFVLLVLPLFLRFVMGHIILVLVKKKYVSKFSEEAFSDEKDREALESVLQILLKKISTPYVHKYDIKSEFLSLILAVQNSYAEKENDVLKFTFSISDLIKCYFLLMTDLNSIFQSKFWINRIKKRKISTLKRINRISGYYNYLYEKIPLLKILRKSRLTGKILRILFIPLLGLPSILLSLVFSLFSLFFTEIIWKYYYSVLLVKCSYYSMILYGNKKSLLKTKLEIFSQSKIKDLAKQVEEIIDPGNTMFRSPLFEKSYIEYQDLLDQYGIKPERDIDFDGIKYRFNKKRKVVKKILELPLNAFRQYIPGLESPFSEKDQLWQIVCRIASVYTDKENFYEELRFLELFETLFMISILAYNKLLLGSLLFDNLSVDFVLKVKDLKQDIFDEVLKNRIPRYKQIYRSFKLIRKSRILYKAVRSANPAGLILSLSGPVAIESIKSQMRDYIFQRTGRFTIFCFESNILKKEKLFSFPEDL
ncbi:MAG: hypothetical protein JEY91_04690 [Spirochaetaceae bacterium]|nr:hypothetical protein [Spirochaetaceae bacterium]